MARAHRQESGERSIPLAVWLGGAALLVVGLVASWALALAHFGAELPGCALDSGCDRAARSAWASVPGIGWPLSFIGVAYMLGALGAWLVSRGAVPPIFRWIVRAGAAVSVLYLGVMATAPDYLCQYCLVVHAVNLGFAIVMETSAIVSRRAGARAESSVGARGATARRWALAAFGGLFVLSSLSLGVASALSEGKAAAKEEGELERSIKQMIVDGENRGDGGEDGRTSPPRAGRPFTGRYRLGPESAPIRIVVISDFQCQDCKRLEQQFTRVLSTRDDVSITMKHFPWNSLCNKHLKGRDLHANACWAARASEAAGRIAGNDGFWKMHDWLFEQSGSFTDASLPPALAELGFDSKTFITTMSDPTIDALIQEDIEEAISLGLYYTPMIFINGRQLRGWSAPDAVIRAVEQIAATNPPVLTAEYDAPPSAREKYIGDWREKTPVALAVDEHDWARGPASGALVEIVVWGDYQEPFTRTLDGRVQAAIAGLGDARYAFRHYPIDQTCNPSAQTTKHPMACLAARAAEAAGRLGGVDGYWRMHDWLFANAQGLNEDALRAAAPTLGFDADALFTEMEHPEVAAAIAEDGAAAKRHGLQGSARRDDTTPVAGIPLIYINGRDVPRWHLEGDTIVEAIIEECRSGGPGSS